MLERSDFSGEMHVYSQRPSSSISTDPNRRVILFTLIPSQMSDIYRRDIQGRVASAKSLATRTTEFSREPI